VENRERILTELCAMRPCLLRPERVPVSGAGPMRAQALQLTFDRAQLRIEPDVTGEALSVALLGAARSAPEGAVLADEDEPWWALMGNPLVAAWAEPSATAPRRIELQMRDDGSRPKLVTIEMREGQLHIGARPK